MNKLNGTMFLILLLAAGSADARIFVFDCNYISFCSVARGCEEGSLHLTYQVDTNTSQSILLGNNGLTDVSLYTGEIAFSFVETLASGALQTTTVNLQDLSSVHSRHTILGVVSSFSQYYGNCEVDGQ